MKRSIPLLLTAAIVFSGCSADASTAASTASSIGSQASSVSSESTAATSLVESTKTPYLPVVDEKDRPRAIITTDLECDDMNSLIHLALYFNEIDVDGIVYSASKFHFQGDGEHTLGEVTPNYLCEGEAVYTTHTGASGPDPEAASLKSYRPFPEGWIEDLWDNEYREAYANLVQNDVNYPTPEYLMSVTKYGNIAFEGDVREATEGSDWIKDAMLDDDDRKLYVYSWGGCNTVVRALLSIAEEYKDTDKWEEITQKIYDKVVISGIEQDNSWTDNKIEEIYPGLTYMHTTNNYGIFFSPLLATDADENPGNLCYVIGGTSPDANDTFNGEWLYENIESNHGPLMEKYNLMADGTVIEGEVDAYQYGVTPIIDWGYDAFPATEFDKYDFISEGDSAGVMALLNCGLRGLENGNYGTWTGRLYYNDEELPTGYNYLNGTTGNANRFLLAYQEDWAARADWCVKGYEETNHAPIIEVSSETITAAPGEPVTFSATITDPDNDIVNADWWVWPEGSIYNGEATELRVWTPLSLSTGFTVPSDAQPGDYFNIILEARDNGEAPITRYNQVIVQVAE